MLLTLIKREIVGNILSFRFIVTFVLFFCLVLVSAFVLTNGYETRLQSYEAASSAHGKSLDEMERLPDPTEQYDELFISKGVYGDLRPQKLSIFVDGLTPSMPSQVHAAMFNSTDEFQAKVLYFLAHEEERRRIVDAGRRLVRTHHRWRTRARELVEMVREELRGRNARSLTSREEREDPRAKVA